MDKQFLTIRYGFLLNETLILLNLAEKTTCYICSIDQEKKQLKDCKGHHCFFKEVKVLEL